jgi:hypothetical protein
MIHKVLFQFFSGGNLTTTQNIKGPSPCYTKGGKEYKKQHSPL